MPYGQLLRDVDRLQAGRVARGQPPLFGRGGRELRVANHVAHRVDVFDLGLIVLVNR